MIQYPHKSNIKHHQWSILTHNSKTKLSMIGKLTEQELEAATVKKQSTKTLFPRSAPFLHLHGPGSQAGDGATRCGQDFLP